MNSDGVTLINSNKQSLAPLKSHSQNASCKEVYVPKNIPGTVVVQVWQAILGCYDSGIVK